MTSSQVRKGMPFDPAIVLPGIFPTNSHIGTEWQMQRLFAVALLQVARDWEPLSAWSRESWCTQTMNYHEPSERWHPLYTGAAQYPRCKVSNVQDTWWFHIKEEKEKDGGEWSGKKKYTHRSLLCTHKASLASVTLLPPGTNGWLGIVWFNHLYLLRF